MDGFIRKKIKEIKSLKIQGARNVAKAVVNLLIYVVEKSKAKETKELYEEMLNVAKVLYRVRPTEPMTRNTIERILNYTFLLINKRENKGKIEHIKSLLVKKQKEILTQMEKNREKIAEYGSEVISDGDVVMTYCHSSTVTKILKTVKDKGRDIRVIACETRPRFQGKITAKELSSYGIDTTLIVDGAMNTFMHDVDVVIVGGDAVTSKGNLINKIGTSTLAHIARMHDTPFYSAVELFKYDPITMFGAPEKIEERDKKEVWEKPPRKVRIRNPAFDVTDSRYISAYITEAGIIPPQAMFLVVKDIYNIDAINRIFRR